MSTCLHSISTEGLMLKLGELSPGMFEEPWTVKMEAHARERAADKARIAELEAEIASKTSAATDWMKNALDIRAALARQAEAHAREAQLPVARLIEDLAKKVGCLVTRLDTKKQGSK